MKSNICINKDVVYFIIPFTLTLLWGIFTANKTAPITEGWFAIYSDLIIDGKIPYVDFEMVFPPLYPYIITGYSILFGDNLLSYRLFGTLLFVVCFVILYFCFRLIFKKSISAIAAFICNSYFFLGPLIIDYDYHTFYHLFLYLTLLSFGIAIKSSKTNQNKECVMYALTGLFASLTLMIRIPCGIMCILFPVIFTFLVERNNIRSKTKQLCIYFIGAIIPLIILVALLIESNALIPFIENTLTGETKGSLFTICTTWFKEWTINAKLIVIILSIIVSYLFYHFIIKDKETNYNAQVSKEMKNYVISSILICITIAILFFLRIRIFETNFLSILICFALLFSLGVILLISILKNNDEKSEFNILLLMMIGFFGIQCVNCGLSGGMDASVCNLGYGIIIGMLFMITKKKSSIPLSSLLRPCVYICVILIVITPFATSIVTPYQWWGATEETYNNNTETTNIPYFENIYMTKEEKNLYEGFVEICDQYLGENDEIYCFPNNPIFYKIAGVLPTVHAPVPWMDVCRDSTAIKDWEYLKNNNPKIIVYSSTGDSIELHEEKFRDGEYCGQRYINDWIVYCINYNVYKVCGEYYTYGGNVTKILVKV